jgi:hypothetical protein
MSGSLKAHLIWNRACAANVAGLEGDKLLAGMILFNGLTMNGGLFHAIECLDPDEQAIADSGYRLFGLEEVVALIRDAEVVLKSGEDLEPHEAVFDRRYWALVPDDEWLAAQFEAYLLLNPSLFAPV